MNNAQIAMLVAGGWFFGAYFYGLATVFGTPAHRFIWWPITLFKFLLRTLWQALTTEWKP